MSVDFETDPVVDPHDARLKKRYYFETTPLRRVLTPTIRGLFNLITARDVTGSHYIPLSGPVVLISNHMGNHDVFLMQFAIQRPIFFMGKEELFRNPILDWAARSLGGFPVQRGQRDQWALNHAQEVLQHGQVLGIFPEGKRSRGHGLAPAKTGAARLALAENCPIVPMGIHGSQYLLRRFPRRTPVHIRIGAPIFPELNESPLALTDRMMFALGYLLPPESRGAYAQRPPGF